jgi:hypothetical protein
LRDYREDFSYQLLFGKVDIPLLKLLLSLPQICDSFNILLQLLFDGILLRLDGLLLGAQAAELSIKLAQVVAVATHVRVGGV